MPGILSQHRHAQRVCADEAQQAEHHEDAIKADAGTEGRMVEIRLHKVDGAAVGLQDGARLGEEVRTEVKTEHLASEGGEEGDMPPRAAPEIKDPRGEGQVFEQEIAIVPEEGETREVFVIPPCDNRIVHIVPYRGVQGIAGVRKGCPGGRGCHRERVPGGRGGTHG